jgi:putative peptide zinc metalloprotease protein
MKRRILILFAAALFAAGFSSARPHSASADNAAVAVNTKDGTTVFKVAFAIKHVMGNVVNETNAAVAYNSCTDCASVAIAFEIVLIDGSPDVVQPTNVAIAINDQCVDCVAVAEAYQFVLGGGGTPLHFDAEGNRILAQIRHELHTLHKADITIEQLQTMLNDMAARIQDVLTNHLVATGPKNPAPAATDTTPTTTDTTPTTTDTTPAATTPTDSTQTTTTPGVTTTTGP